MSSAFYEADFLELTKLQQWVACKLTPKKDNPAKMDKLPINPHTGGNAQSDNPATWAKYAEAEFMMQILRHNGGKAGVGFEFGQTGKPSGIVGIDLDHVIHDGKIEEYAAEIIRLMDSYTEISQSGEGIHILCKSSKTLHEMNSDINTGFNRNGVEIYDSGKFFMITGEIYGGMKPINERTAQLEQIVKQYYTPKPKPQIQPTQQQQVTFSTPDKSNSELWEVMFNSEAGDKIRRLYGGDISEYKSIHKDGNEYLDPSEADLALCGYLAFYTGGDYSRIEAMMNESALGARDKWRTRADYRQLTINLAIASKDEYYTGKQKSEQTPAKLKQQTQQEVIAPSQPLAFLSFVFGTEYLDSSFEGDMRNFQKYSQRKTGFSNLDERLTIYPAFYVIGAISSLGKTTFNLQLADNFAGMGEHVLYFALEQTRFELVSKSLARLCQPEGAIYESSPTAMEIRKGRITPELRGAIERYKEIAKNYSIVECDFETTASTIIDTINAYIQQYGVKPVVFIDYLQLVRSSNSKLTNTKDIVDDVVRALKKYQMQNELTMFVISSLNRQNYLTVIDFESFKETGGIEYTADCVMGLQLAVMNTGLFETDTKTGKKRKVVKAAKKATPRQIELCILKNRYGISNESFYFQYYPKFDLFLPSTKDIAKEAAEKLVASIPDDDGPRKKPK